MNNLCIKKFTLFLCLLFAGNLIFSQSWTQQGESIGSTTNPMQTVALNGTGEIMAYSLSYPKNTSTSETLGLVRVIKFDGTTWNQIGGDINYGGIYKSTYEDTAELALSLSDDGTILAVGAPMTNNWKGKVAVFKFDGTNWNQIGQELTTTAYANPSFGGALKITPDGSTIIIGSSNTITTASFYGMVEVYHLDSSTSQWTQVGQSLVNTSNTNGGGFGYDVDINDAGNIIAVSQTNGSATIYQLDGTIWLQTAQFTDSYYTYVSLNAAGDRLALGSMTATNTITNVAYAGLAKVYNNDGGTWNQIGQTTFGTSMFQMYARVRLNAEGNILAVGSEGISSLIPKAQVYKFLGNSWTQIGQTIEDTKGTFFGHDVDMDKSGQIVAIGSREGTGTANPHLAKIYKFQCNDDAPTVAAPQPVCANSFVALTATSTEGNTVNWYASADATTPIFTGKTFETPALSETTTYWVEAVTTIGCASTRKEVVVTILPAPELVIENTEVAICKGSKALLNATSANNVIFWYANQADTTYLYHGNLFQTPELTESKTYWVESFNLATGCRSARVEVKVTVNPIPAAPVAVANQQYVAGQTLADLEVTFTGTLKWYADQYLNVELPNTTVLVSGKTYYVLQTANGCTSEATSITVEEKLAVNDVTGNVSKYYPNPVSDQFTIESKDTIDNIEVYSLTGKLILTKKINSKNTTLNLSTLTSGNYLVKVTGAGKTDVIKVIKK